MRKCNSKFTSMILALVMLASLIVVPSAAASELNEITGLVWDVNSITGIKLANSAADSANMQAMLAIYNGKELDSLITADVHSGSKKVLFPSATELAAGQTAKALLWDTTGGAINPLAVNYPVTPDGEAYSSCEIRGNSLIVLPGDNANYRTKNAFSLFDSELNENVKALFTISGDTTGLTMLADGTLLATPESNAGTITVNALYGCKTYTKEVTLVKGLYEDFESYSSGEDIAKVSSDDGWEDSRGGSVTIEADGNGYLGSCSNSYMSYNFSQNCASENITVEYDIRNSASPVQIKGTGTSEASAIDYYVPWTFSSTGTYLRLYYDKDGNYTSSYKNIHTMDTTKWTRVKTIYNLVNNTYSLYVDNEPTEIIDYKLPTSNAVYVFNAVVCRAKIDDISVYTGEAYEPYEIKGYSDIVLPGDDASFSTNVSYSLVDKDTNLVVNGAEYAISGTTDGITIDNNGTLTLTKDAKAGKLTISANKNGKTYLKEVTTIKGYSTDFEKGQIGVLPTEWFSNSNDSKIAESDGNKYLLRAGNYVEYELSSKSKFNGESVTIEFDTLLYDSVANQQLPYFKWRLKEDGSEDERYNFIGLRNTEVGGVVTQVGLHTNYFDEFGNSISDRNFVKYVDNGSIFKTKYVIDYVSGTYDLYIDDELILDDYSFPNVGSDYGITAIQFRTCIDNVHIYTGTKN